MKNTIKKTLLTALITIGVISVANALPHNYIDAEVIGFTAKYSLPNALGGGTSIHTITVTHAPQGGALFYACKFQLESALTQQGAVRIQSCLPIN